MFCYSDDFLDTIEVNLFSEVDISPAVFNLVLKGKFSNIYTITLKGELIMAKEYNNLSDVCKSTTLAFKEVRLLTFIGSHPNIPECFGIFIYKTIPHVLISHCGTNTLSKLISSSLLDSDHVKNAVKDISEALIYLHNKGVVHNYVRINSVHYTHMCKYILSNFDLACRAEVAKPLTQKQIQSFKDDVSIPPELLSGKVAPSPASDVYAFGWLIRQLCQSARLRGSLSERLCYIQGECTSIDPSNRPNNSELYRCINYACSKSS